MKTVINSMEEMQQYLKKGAYVFTTDVEFTFDVNVSEDIHALSIKAQNLSAKNMTAARINAKSITAVNVVSSKGITADKVSAKSIQTLGSLRIKEANLERPIAMENAEKPPRSNKRNVDNTQKIDNIATPVGIEANAQAAAKEAFSDETIKSVFSLLDTRRELEGVEGTESIIKRIEEMLSQLVESVVKFLKATREGKTADADIAHFAIKEGNVEALKEVVAELPNLHDKLALSVLNRGDLVGNNMLQEIINATDDKKDFVLKLADRLMGKSDIKRVVKLLSQTAQHLDHKSLESVLLKAIEQDKKAKDTKMSRAVISAYTPLLVKDFSPQILKYVIKNNNIAVAKELIDKGINVKDSAPILTYAAAKAGNKALLQKLIANGSDVNSQNCGALKECLKNKDIKSAVLLVQNGAKMSDFLKETRLMSENGDMTHLDKSFVAKLRDKCKSLEVTRPERSVESEAEQAPEMEQ